MPTPGTMPLLHTHAAFLPFDEPLASPMLFPHPLRRHLQAWLRQFKDSDRVITAADIKGFFSGLQEGRRVRSRPDEEEVEE